MCPPTFPEPTGEAQAASLTPAPLPTETGACVHLVFAPWGLVHLFPQGEGKSGTEKLELDL